MKKHLPLLFLPGMLSDDRVFEPQLNFCKLQSYPFTVADLSQGESIAEMAEAGFAKAASLGWDDFLVCGLSLGGVVAMEMMGWPEVAGAILINTDHRADTQGRKAERDEQIRKVHQGWFKEIIKGMKPFYLHRDEGRRARQLWKLFQEMVVSQGEEVFIRQTLALRERDSYEGVIRDFGGPCLILCGEEDALYPPQCHRDMAALMRQAELHILPQAGFLVTLEQPEQVNRLMKKWISGLSDGAVG